ncbi:MAG: DNA repair protein RadC [Tannerella sp.]|jgi:DNA repair protein RadC|nr:DNA repair protein RadC [Tannerella sp.]
MEQAGKLRIKDWAVEDRPREKMLLKGVSSLSDAELLAILIRSGNKDETAIELAQQILAAIANNLNELGKYSVKDLMEYNGIGEAKAITILAALELGRRRGAAEPLQRAEVKCSRDAYQLFSPLLCDLSHEELWAAFLNRRNKVMSKTQISRGGMSETTADVKMIIKPAIEARTCSSIVVGHNHPSGTCHPSQQDDHLTLRLKEAATLMGITLLDHIIICENTYYSYADEGRL